MHRSKLVAIGIDCQSTDLTESAKFWGAALGRSAPSSLDAKDPKYLTLGSGREPLVTFCQNVDHPSGVHLDIETDDIEAEVRRLERLGAKRVKQIKTWWVLEAPTGHRFCVVQPQRGELPSDANIWDEHTGE
jgi:predicted enzyme related to lactoylglutathione lyase